METLFTTKDAVKCLLNTPLHVQFLRSDDKDIHIFKSNYGNICMGIYGDGEIKNFIPENHLEFKWLYSTNTYVYES